MFLIEVIPIARGIGIDTLSYFSSARIDLGSLVSVPLRKKEVHALVVSVRDAQEVRAEIKSSSYSIRKVTEFKASFFLPEPFMKAVLASARFFATTPGSILSHVLPKSVLGNEHVHSASCREVAGHRFFDRLVIQSDDAERFAQYRMCIREEFAKRQSVYFCVGTAEEAKRAVPLLSKGIEEYTLVLYGSLPKKKMAEVIEKVMTSKHPVLIIATAHFLSVCPANVSMVILENDSSRSFRVQSRPFIDMRVWAELFAKESELRFLVGGALLRTETLYRYKQGEFSELTPLTFRSLSPALSHIVDMRKAKKPGGSFEVLSDELVSLIEKTQSANQSLFLFASRRGLSPQTVCGDCGTSVVCHRCHAPVVLHKKRAGMEDNFFYCHGCGEKRSAEERCAYCQSWKLVPLGIGVELLDQEICKRFPSVKVFRLDKDTASTAQKAIKIVADFYNTPGSVLVGTEMAMSFLDAKIDNTAVASLDSLFSFPDFRIHERIVHLLLRIRSLTLTSCIVQTRLPEERVLEYALKGNLTDFYREELAERKAFNYPPFSVLIKISLAGTRVAVTKEMEKVSSHLAPYTVELFPAFTEERRGLFTMHGLIRLPKGSWPDEVLLDKLLALPPQFRVMVEPESLL
ncbi:MAG: hypothetical protein NUV54_00800 [Candidatus Taylorbacteria bacterium]|nr:hypothetical protein [Candidatus Taylorbacteria bacterium]